MTGVLAAEGIRVGVTRVGQSLSRVNPDNHERRKSRTDVKQTLIPTKQTILGTKSI